MNKDRQRIARCIVRVIDAVLGVMGEGRLTEGQGRVMAALLARMVSREFLRALARALRMAKPDEREAEVRYLVTVLDVGHQDGDCFVATPPKHTGQACAPRNDKRMEEEK